MEGSGETIGEESVTNIFSAEKYLECKLKWTYYRLHRMFFTFRRVMRARALLWQTDRSCHVSMSSLTSWTSPRKSLSLSSMWVDDAKQVRMGNHSVWVALDMKDEDRKTNVRCSLKQAQVQAVNQMIKVYGLPNNENAAKHWFRWPWRY